MKKILFIVFAITMSMHMNAQGSSISLSGGYTTNGIGVLANYNIELNRNSYVHLSGYYSIAEDQQKNYDIAYNNLSLNVGYFYNVLTTADRRFTISLGGGGLVGYEIINNGNSTLDTGAIVDGDSKVIYGGFVGADTSYSLTDALSLTLIVQEYYHNNSDLGNFALYSGLGIRYHFY